ncbi:MAG: hypothetical protein DRN96_02060 [Thermoproteota archaeon]|nr:MAG: hypothetical protein DRN96_02060 [Candidatus Korarchaeota archaeon]
MLILATALLISFAVGSSDESMAVPVGFTRRKAAVLVGALMAAAGAMASGEAVERMLGAKLYTRPLGRVELETVGLVSSALIVLFALLGVPLSTAQVVTGAAIGAGLRSISLPEVAKLALAWCMLPAASYTLAYLAGAKVLKAVRAYSRGSLARRTAAERGALIASYLASLLLAFARGGNTIGLGSFLAIREVGGAGRALCAASMALGVALVSSRVATSLGLDVMSFPPSVSLAFMLPPLVLLHVMTAAGIPVSTSQLLLPAMLGAARASGIRTNVEITVKMLSAWVASVPLAATCSYAVALTRL